MKIEKNIPIPDKMSITKIRTNKWSVLEIGDSILFENAKEANTILCNIIQWIKRTKRDWKMAQRKVDGGIRIWRVK